MKAMFRMLKLLKPYKGLAMLNMLFNLIQILAGLFSLALVMPLLDFMFNNNREAFKQKSVQDSGDFNSLYNNFIQWMTDLVDDNRQQALFWICISLLVATIIKNIARYLALYFLVILRNRIIRDIRRDLYDKILELPISYFSDERKGDIISRMSNDVKEVEWSLMASLEAIFKEPVTIVFYIGSLIYMSPKLTLYIILLLPFAAGSIALLGKSLRRKSKRNQEQQSAVLSFLEESLGGIRIIKAFAVERVFRRKFTLLNQQSALANIKVNHRGDMASPISETLGIIVACVLLWFGGNMVFDGEIKGSAFLAYFAIFSQVIPPFKQLSQAFPMVQRGAAGMDRYEEILKSDIKIYEKKDARELNRIEKGISYEQINFSYNAGGQVLHNVSFEIPKNKKVALVGASGSGKSTLADLLPRFYDCESGCIKIDDIDIREFKLKDLRSMMGIVTQEAILFNDTIANNILFGQEGKTMQDIIEAARLANALEFIEKTENGFETVIGERGSKLSGGQRQRLAIARALLKNPEILILDEATSALDNESEKLVQQALDNLREGRTTLVIAHRLTTIQDADEIIVLDRGHIVERGTHDTLLDRKGHYYRLYTSHGLSN
ncbi:MAG: ABC transporter ATP-binding protein [Bacteroidetes bacterium]|nr:ABC transporter ATP-binding protein [Bacteroidota bacterium]